MRALMLDAVDNTPYLGRLATRLARLGVEMHYAGDPEYKDFDALGRAGISCHPLRLKHKLDFRVRSRIRRMLRDLSIDVLHTQTGRDSYVGIRARGKMPIRTLISNGAFTKLGRFDPVRWFVFGRRGADKVITVSDAVKRHLVEQGFEPERVTTVYRGIWSEEIVPTYKDLRAEYGIPAEDYLIGFVGKWRPIKGFEYLLQALEELQRRGPRFHLLVAGAGYEAQAEQIAARGLEPRITLLGTQPDIMSFTPNLDCLVMPSRAEALGRAAVEATVVGTPVIATRVGGLPEVVDEGRAGVLVDPERSGSLADALEEAIASPDKMRALADAALVRNRDLFDIERCAQCHLELYRGP